LSSRALSDGALSDQTMRRPPAGPISARGNGLNAMVNDDTSDSTERLLSRTQAAAALGVSVRTLERMEAAGRGPPSRRISKQIIKYPANDLRAWLEARTTAGIALKFRSVASP
jgi:predicted DNA-binding transcriptional regulator AlpA